VGVGCGADEGVGKVVDPGGIGRVEDLEILLDEGLDESTRDEGVQVPDQDTTGHAPSLRPAPKPA
jgi:hypothetical protein